MLHHIHIGWILPGWKIWVVFGTEWSLGVLLSSFYNPFHRVRISIELNLIEDPSFRLKWHFSHFPRVPPLLQQQMSTSEPVQCNNIAVICTVPAIWELNKCPTLQLQEHSSVQCRGHSKTWMFHTINPRPLIRSFVEKSNNDDNSSEKYKT